MGELLTAQKSIVNHTGSCVVLGAAGTGKTTAMVERIAHILSLGVRPEEIYVAAFTYYAWQVLSSKIADKVGADVVARMNIGTMRIFAQNQIEKDEGAELVFATDKQYRRALKSAMQDVSFKGTAVEAEHIIRTFKSMARKPKEDAPHYNLLLAYKKLCEMDRYDVLRKHIIGLRSGSHKHVPMKYVFVDNFQDITHIQFLWLMEHVKAGSILTAFGDDDITAFKRDGAMGASAFIDVENAGVPKLTLENVFRTAPDLGLALQNITAPLKDRLPKNIKYNSKKRMSLEFESYASPEEELAVLVQKIKALDDGSRIGVITRTDWDALRIQKLFEKNGIEHSSFAHKIWEIPGAIMVLDLLTLLMNAANDVHLRNVLMGYGLNQSLIEALFKGGLHALDWLPSGAKLPKNVELPAAALAEFSAVQRQLSGCYNMMKSRVIAPQDIFKAAAYDMIKNMNAEDKSNALVAVDTLINLKGPLKEVLPQIREGKEPNVHDRILLGPIRDMRNLEFDYVFMPMVHDKNYPKTYAVLPTDEGHDKRLFYMALTRCSKVLQVSWSGTPSTYLSVLQKALKKA